MKWWQAMVGHSLVSNASGQAGNLGCNGITHARPLYETDGLEALQLALDNLTNISALQSLTGRGLALTLPTKPAVKRQSYFLLTEFQLMTVMTAIHLALINISLEWCNLLYGPV